MGRDKLCSMDSETFPIADAGRVAVWILTDNHFDLLRRDGAITKRHRVPPGGSVHAEHGPAYSGATRGVLQK